MIIKKTATLHIPRTIKENEYFIDLINSYLKLDSKVTKVPRRAFKSRVVNKGTEKLWKVLEEKNVIRYINHWSSNKTTRGAFYKDAWSHESDCDLELMSPHQTAKIKRRAGRRYNECACWDRYYKNKPDIKRYYNVIHGDKKLM